ncbi:MAG: DUF4271 domain-containing protein [Parafilimonas sp.]
MLLPAIIFAQDTNATHKQKDSVQSIQKFLTHKDSVYLDSLKKVQDNIFRKDTAVKDSIAIVPIINRSADSAKTDSLKHDSLLIQPQAPVKTTVPKKNVVHLMPGTERDVTDKDIIFYILVFLLFFLGLVKTSFPKYVNSIFSLSFQATFRQSQTKEQMSQNFFPAFMLNVMFILCGGLFITLFATFNHWTKIVFWQLFVYSTAILFIVYLTKYLIIRFTGWVFNAKDAAVEYRFVVFLINKLLGVIIIPFLFLIAYADDKTKNIAVTIVVCITIFSLAVRYLVSLARIRKNLSITAFHFFIYLCAVEIMPLLVIYKLLFLQTSNK